MDYLIEPERKLEISAETEVLVLGGGPSGITAAVASARTGAKTLLLERYGFLGGMGTAAMVTNFCGLHANINGSVQQIVHGIADDILDRLGKLDGLNAPHHIKAKGSGHDTAAQAYDTAAYKVVSDELLNDAGVDIRFHSLAADVIMKDKSTIDAVILETKSGRKAIRARMFIDCSGDADLAFWSGARVEKGNDDGFIAYPTTMFRIGNVDDDLAHRSGRPNLNDLIAKHGDNYNLPRKTGIINSQAHKGEWRANLTQISRLDGSPIDGSNWDDLCFAEAEGRRQVLEYHNFLKECVPGFKESYLLETAAQVGIRETRRIVGAHVLTEDEVLDCADFDDVVGCNGWPLEQHLKGAAKWTFLGGRGYHQIPYRSLIPLGVDNLLVAGRCASATPEGQSSIRVSGPCFVMGQAAGTAANLALQSNKAPRSISIADLQNKLSMDGVFFGN